MNSVTGKFDFVIYLRYPTLITRLTKTLRRTLVLFPFNTTNKKPPQGENLDGRIQNFKTLLNEICCIHLILICIMVIPFIFNLSEKLLPWLMTIFNILDIVVVLYPHAVYYIYLYYIYIHKYT